MHPHLAARACFRRIESLAEIGVPRSRFEADCKLAAVIGGVDELFPCQVSEWIAPARRAVVVMTISDPPVGARITHPANGSA